MMPARVRIKSAPGREVLAFVAIAGASEVRVRWTPPSNFRCDVHGASPLADCPHAAAVRAATDYQIEFSND